MGFSKHSLLTNLPQCSIMKIEKSLSSKRYAPIVSGKNNRHKFGSKGRLFFLIVMITVFMIVVDVCDKGCQFEEKTPQFQQIAKSYNAVHHKESPPICSRGTYGS